ncbi:SPOR domain-containing protein [Oceanibacterium hippocampi]|nr:SPOR domain-containing protein [Oceanibacterium hippocampi]
MHDTWRKRLLAVTMLAASVPLGGCEVLREAGIELPGLNVPAIPAQSPKGTAVAAESDYAVMMRVAETTHANGDLATALHLYARAHQIEPARTEPLAAMGTLLRRSGRNGDAIQVQMRILELAPGNAAAHREVGYNLLAQDKPFQAGEEFRRALESAPGDVLALNGLAVSYDRIGDNGTAIALYRQALALEPDNLAVRNNLGLSLALGGEFDQSIALLEAVAADPAATAQHRRTLAIARDLAGRNDGHVAAQPAAPARPVEAALSLSAPVAASETPPESGPVSRPAPTTAGKSADPAASMSAEAAPDEPAPAGAAAALLPVHEAPLKSLPETIARQPAGDPEIGIADEHRRYFVQFGAFDSEADAETAWQAIIERHDELLRYQPTIKPVYLGDSRGIRFRLRIGSFGDATQTREMVEELKARGLDCYRVWEA